MDKKEIEDYLIKLQQLEKTLTSESEDGEETDDSIMGDLNNLLSSLSDDFEQEIMKITPVI